MKKAIIIGVGPEKGIGGAVCKRFAAEGLHVFIAGRTAEALETLADNVSNSTGGKVTPIVADTTKEADVINLFDLVEKSEGDELAVAVYNAGNNMNGELITMEADFFERCWRVACFGGFLFGREAIRRMLPQENGTLIFTGASASLRGRAMFTPFNSAKAGLRAMAQAMAKEYGPQGIHVGHVIIDGGVGGDKVISRFPQLVEQLGGEEGLIGLEGIADAYWYLYTQQRRAWTFELDLRTHREKW